MNAFQRVFIVSAVFLLSACAPKPPSEILSSAKRLSAEKSETSEKRLPVAERQAKKAKVSSWEIRGAMAAKNRRTKKGWSATMNWRQQGPNRYQIRLFGPIGSGTVMIERQGGAITYRDGTKKITSHNADQLLRQQTGISLPVKNLYYWVKGMPAPGSVQAKQYDRYNHLTRLRQDGYTIDYMRYTSVGNADLPSLIRLQGHGVFIKLIIKRWRV